MCNKCLCYFLHDHFIGRFFTSEGRHPVPTIIFFGNLLNRTTVVTSIILGLYLRSTVVKTITERLVNSKRDNLRSPFRVFSLQGTQHTTVKNNENEFSVKTTYIFENKYKRKDPIEFTIRKKIR